MLEAPFSIVSMPNCAMMASCFSMFEMCQKTKKKIVDMSFEIFEEFRRNCGRA